MNTRISLSLTDSVLNLTGVGPAVAEKLNGIGIVRLQDLLFHLPLRYQDRTRISAIDTLQHGEEVLVEGEIELTQVQFSYKRSLSCVINDGSGSLTLRFFHFSKTQQKQLVMGTTLRCYGKVRSGRKTLEMLHPVYQHIDPDNIPVIEQQLTAIYPLTKGLQQKTMQRLCSQALDILLTGRHDQPIELIPDEILSVIGLPNMIAALRYVHCPPRDADIELLRLVQHPAQQRLIFEELLSQRLSLEHVRQKIQVLSAPPLVRCDKLRDRFMRQLGFSLTDAQNRVLEDIDQDLKKNIPMLRLLQGDVGSGKTVVAACAALNALGAGYQVVLMVPTELLAVQHAETFMQWFTDLGEGYLDIKVLLITAKSTSIERNVNMGLLRDNKAVMAIGTHALFQKGITFSNIGLVIIDEQHRFGVDQRLSLLDKGMTDNYMPHQFVMTATPIPRTLAMTACAYLDLSTIDSLPPNRKAINTVVISNDRRNEIIARIKTVCDDGRQVYWVCTLIEESLVLQCQTATETFQQLTEDLHGVVNVGLIHGKMKSKDKKETMIAFKAKKIQLLVATTVIEVGVDIPAASLIIIENAERLGLAQLHQLRGRVGRASIKSDCILMYQAPLSDLARSRLEIMRGTNDGFKIAEQDMQLRGCGDLAGTRQTGLPDLRIANLFRDAGMVPDVQQAAKILQQKYPDNIELLIDRWLGNGAQYGSV